MLPTTSRNTQEGSEAYFVRAAYERAEALGDSGGASREINDAALANLDSWVPRLGTRAKRQELIVALAGAMAQRRQHERQLSSERNQGLRRRRQGHVRNRRGDLKALKMDFGDAVDWLKDKLGIRDLPRVNLVFRKPSEDRQMEEEQAAQGEQADGGH